MAMKTAVQQARELHQRGKLLREIADSLGISVATASLYCRGVKPRWKNGEDPRKAEILPLLRTLYSAGKPISVIARLTGVPAPTLYDWRRELKLPKNARSVYVDDALRRRIGKAVSRDQTGELAAQAARLYVEDEMSAPDIASLMGVTATTVGQWLKKGDVKIRARPSMRTRSKLRKANLGPKRYNWKGGITPQQIRIRRSLLMRAAREVCFERDGFVVRPAGNAAEL